jgi:hypothetical protein
LNLHRVCVLPPSQATPDQVTDRLAWRSTRLLLVKQALPVFPLDTLSPLGLDVTVPLRPVTLSVTRDLPAGHAAAGFTVKAAVLVTPPALAVIVTDTDAVTGDVATVNPALVAPAATVTLAGTVATAVLLLESVTTVPPEGAAAVSVTVPLTELPPVTLAEPRVSALKAGAGALGETVSAAVRVTPWYEAERVIAVEDATTEVVTVNAALS